MKMQVSTEFLTLGGGCFWCLEAVFLRVRGIESVQSGYSNGHLNHPTYEQVCGGATGHAEVIRLEFDPEQIGLEQILQIFFVIHDPTTLNRQGNDVGTQYRSGIYYHEASQNIRIEAFMNELIQSTSFQNSIVTEIAPVTNYFPAEAYHQNYFERNPHQGYCSFVVGPKVAKFRKTFADWVKS